MATMKASKGPLDPDPIMTNTNGPIRRSKAAFRSPLSTRRASHNAPIPVIWPRSIVFPPVAVRLSSEVTTTSLSLSPSYLTRSTPDIKVEIASHAIITEIRVNELNSFLRSFSVLNISTGNNAADRVRVNNRDTFTVAYGVHSVQTTGTPKRKNKMIAQ